MSQNAAQQNDDAQLTNTFNVVSTNDFVHDVPVMPALLAGANSNHADLSVLEQMRLYKRMKLTGRI